MTEISAYSSSFWTSQTGPQGFITHMSRDLSDTDKAVFDKIWTQHRPKLEQAGVRVDALMIQIAQMVKNTPFDLADLKTTHALFEQTKREMDQEIAQFLFDLLPALSNEGRQSLRLAPPHLQKKK